MKKTLLTIALTSALALVNTAVAAEAETGYVGLKAGWSHTETPSSHHVDSVWASERNDWSYGAYAGYNFFSFLGAEVGYGYYGDFKNAGSYNGTKLGHYKVHGAELALVPSIPLNDTDDIFFKLGGLYANVDDDAFGHTASGVAPLLGAGVRVAFGDVLVRAEYEFAHKIAEKDDFGYAPELNNFSVGVEYKFGGATPVVAPVPAPAPVVEEPKTEVVNKQVTLDATALFGFNKTELSVAGKANVAKVADEIKSNNLQNVQIKVEGHTDRLGSESYNQKLSQARAQAVVDEFINDGISKDNISAEGFGESTPVTGTSCNGVKGKQKLIDCLAPDRRVEVKFQGVKQLVVEAK